MSKSGIEHAFLLYLRTRARNIPEPEREYRFHETRKWRFDFAWPRFRFALEIDGLVYDGKGGHQTVDGVKRDCEKYEAAMLDGWTVYRVPGQWIADGTGRWTERLPEVAKTVARMIEIQQCKGVAPCEFGDT